MPARSAFSSPNSSPDARRAPCWGAILSALSYLGLAILLLAAPAHAQPSEQRLTRTEARAYALQLLKQDQPAAARAVALGLLRVDPDDYNALIVLSQAENRLGRPGKSAFAAKRAYRKATSDEQRFTAAYSVSQALTAQKRYGGAQWWLRRAGQASSDNPGLDRAARSQFRRVKELNPWSVRLGVSIAPTSNLNSGPTSNSYEIGGTIFVDPTAVPLSGLEVGTRFSIRRDFRGKTRGGPSFYAQLSGDDRRYVLSSAARAAVPTARAGDFAFSSLELTLGTFLPDANTRGGTGVSLQAGRNWRGGARLASFTRLRVNRNMPLGPGAALGLSLSFEDQTRHDRAARSAQVLTLGTTWVKRLADNSRLTLGASLVDTRSASNQIAHGAMVLSLAYAHGQRILGAEPRLSLTYVARDYDRVAYGTTPRRDDKIALGVELLFSQVDYLGFSPTINLDYARNRSNVSIFDYEEFGMSFGFRSTF